MVGIPMLLISERPLHLTLLYSVDVPDSKFGGDTLFIDMVSALQRLPKRLKQIVQTRDASHEILWAYKIGEIDVCKSIKQLCQEVQEKGPKISRPCVLVHPITGNKSLYVNPTYTTSINDLSSSESDNCLRNIFECVLTEDNILRYKWSVNDLLIYDNRSMIHTATPVDDNRRRVVYRIGIMES